MQGQGYLVTPGIHTLAQISGWRKVTDAVRAAGGRMFLQIMHAGRISHPENTPDHHQPVAPSVVRPNVQMVTPSGMRDIPEPRALRTDEIADIVDDFRRAARNARGRRRRRRGDSRREWLLDSNCSYRPTPTTAPISTAGRSKTAFVLPSKWRRPSRRRSDLDVPAFASPRQHLQ